MQRQTTRYIKIAPCIFLALAALTIAGCGNHDQADTSSGTKTPDQVRQDAVKNNQDFANHPPPSATPPAAKPSTGP